MFCIRTCVKAKCWNFFTKKLNSILDRYLHNETICLNKTSAGFYFQCNECRYINVYSYQITQSNKLCFQQRSAIGGMVFVACPCVRPACTIIYKKSLTWYLTSHSKEFHQIFNFDAVEDVYEGITFWGQKVKREGHSKNKQEQLRTFFQWRHTPNSLLTTTLLHVYTAR